MKRPRVLLGMSGGTDSSVSAMLLKDQGYDVVGITFLFSGKNEMENITSLEAKSLAKKLKIEHNTIDLREVFEETVIGYFVSEYQKGNTPFPCAYCNPKVKFYYLEKYAEKYSCDHISTGHYVQKIKYNGKNYLFRGIDPDKDQSFFLWGLRQSLIDKLIFPLGSKFKSSVKKLAVEKGFYSLSTKTESMGICFIENGNYRKFMESRGIISEKGNFVNTNGEILGEHCGIINYTVGQRRGLGLNLNFPVFVSEFRLDANEIVLSEYGELYKNWITIYNYQFIDIEEVKSNMTYIVKVRYRLQETACKINILNDTVAEVELLKSEAMIANGQTAVFYDGDRLIGGGFILSSK